jgi:ribonuclease HI
MSGSALVQLNTERADNVERTHGFAVRASGSNYLAEMCAILAAILAAPANAPVTIFTDCQSAIHQINRYRDRAPDGQFRASFHLPQRRRVVGACRPVVKLIRRAIQDREGAVHLRWVPSHTQGRATCTRA